jgi:5-methylthioadenosine/S-adenosylhomocysteine deaminase
VTQLISPRWIVPVEPANTVLENHSLVVEGSRIGAVLPTSVARQQFSGATETLLPNHLLVPGFVNAHTHAAMTLMRGLADDTPLMTWLTEHIWPAETKYLSEEYVYDGTELAIAEMLRSGTTCFADMYFFHNVAARAARKHGIRAALGAAIIEFPTPYAADAEGYIARGLESRSEFAEESRLKLMLGPHAPYTVSDKTFIRVATIAEEAGFPVMLHVHETRDELTQSEKEYGVRPIARLEKLGVLTPNLIAVHCVHMNAIEIEQFARAGVNVTHCPASNLKLASGFSPVNEMLKAGVNVAIGTDGAASNNRLDMLSETRLASLVQKALSQDAAALPAHQILAMATLHGAKALGWDKEIGSLVSGKCADMTAIDLSSIETQPCYDPVSHLFHAAGRENVTHVWVDGELLLDNRVLTRMDSAELQAKSSLWQNRFANR